MSINIDFDNPTWKSGDGSVVRITDMDTNHIRNAMRYCQENKKDIPYRIDYYEVFETIFRRELKKRERCDWCDYRIDTPHPFTISMREYEGNNVPHKYESTVCQKCYNRVKNVWRKTLEQSFVEYTREDETDMSYSIEIGCIIESDPDKHDIYHVTPYETQPEMDCPLYNLKDTFVRVMGWEFEQGKYYPLSEALEHINRGIKTLTDEGYKVSVPYSLPENRENVIVLRHLIDWQECITEIAEKRDGDLNNLLFKW